MAGTSIRRSVAEPEHLLFGVPTITYLAFAVFPLGAIATVIGFKPGLAIGTVAAVVIHVTSIILRLRHPFLENLIAYAFFRALKVGLWHVFKRRSRIYLR